MRIGWNIKFETQLSVFIFLDGIQFTAFIFRHLTQFIAFEKRYINLGLNVSTPQSTHS